jgi:hypothetical protein
VTQQEDAAVLAAVVLPFKQAARQAANPISLLMQDLLLPDLVDVIVSELPLLDLDPLSTLAGATDMAAPESDAGDTSKRRTVSESRRADTRTRLEALQSSAAPFQTGDTPVFPLRRRSKSATKTGDWSESKSSTRQSLSDDTLPQSESGYSTVRESESDATTARVRMTTALIGELADDVLRQVSSFEPQNGDRIDVSVDDAEGSSTRSTLPPKVAQEQAAQQLDDENLNQQPTLNRIAALVKNVVTRSSSAIVSTDSPSQAATDSGNEALPPFLRSASVPELTQVEPMQPSSGEELEPTLQEPLDPDALAALVNEALVKQARRYGVDFS